MLKKIICIIFSIILIFSVSIPAFSYTPTGLNLTANSALLVSLDNDVVIYSKDENKKVYPASITKIMTVLLMLESDLYDPEAPVVMTEEVKKLISGTGSSVSTLAVGEQIRMIDLAYYVLMSSAGDCAYLLSITFGNSVDNFVKMMNDRAAKLGLKGTHYENPVGLHSENNYTTAKDTYILAKEALKNKTFKTICETARYTVPETNMSKPRTLSTTNFLQDSSTNYFYQYAKGVKTGFTDEAGRCLVSTASYNGYNYMCILFGCPANLGRRVEFEESRELYRWAFNNFRYKTVAETTSPVYELPVDLSFSTDYVSLYVKESFITVLPKDADDSTISIKPNIKKGTVIDAPIKKGQVLGTADIYYAQKKIGTVKLVSKENIESSFILIAVRGVKRFFASKYMKVVYVLIGVALIAFVIGVIRLNKQRFKKKKKIKYIPMKDEDWKK